MLWQAPQTARSLRTVTQYPALLHQLLHSCDPNGKHDGITVMLCDGSRRHITADNSSNAAAIGHWQQVCHQLASQHLLCCKHNTHSTTFHIHASISHKHSCQRADTFPRAIINSSRPVLLVGSSIQQKQHSQAGSAASSKPQTNNPDHPDHVQALAVSARLPMCLHEEVLTAHGEGLHMVPWLCSALINHLPSCCFNPVNQRGEDRLSNGPTRPAKVVYVDNVVHQDNSQTGMLQLHARIIV
jgi:hypothetical protein